MHPSVKSLESVVKRVRDVLRKGDGITDMDSMAHCVLFTAARMLDTATAAKLNVPYTWDAVISKVLAKDINGADKAFKDILEVLDSKFSTNEFTWKLKVQDDFEKIVRLFNELDIHEVAKHTDVLGFIYEQHISTGSGAGRDLGKFYTDRQITRYLTELLGSDITAGRPDSMCDATMGTGGFILSYIEYVTKMCPDVKWDDYDLAGGDIDDKVAAIARLNVFLRTGKLFPMIRKRNTLKNDIGDSSDKRKTFKLLLMNIPFGVKGLTLADDCCQRVKDIVKAGTKSEPLFMALVCQLLAEGGKAGVIVPDGVLVNCSKQHDTFRKYLLDNFKVLRIIKMRGKFFMNTGIQPSVIVFERNGKTDIVEFWDVEKKESGELVETCMLTVPREKFDGSCSFDMRRYQETKVVANSAGFPMVKLSDVCEVSFGERITQKNDKGTLYPVYGSGGDTFRTDEYNREGKTCKLGRFAISESNMVMFVEGKYWLMDSGFTVKSKNREVMLDGFLWYLLLSDKHRLSEISTGSCQKNIEMERFYQLDYVLPPLSIQKEIVESLDLIYNNANTAKLAAAPIKAQMAAVMRSIGARGYEKKKLGSICSFINGYAFKSEEFTNTGIPVIKIKNIKNNIINIDTAECVRENEGLSRFIVKDNEMVISLTGELSGDVGLNTTGVNCYLNQRTARIDVTSDIIISKYLYYYTVYSNFVLNVRELSSGSAQPNVSTKKIEELQIPIPPLPIQQEVLAILNEMESELKTMEQMAAKADQRAKYILEGYLTS
jgi:type I restriction enzyme S subunit